MSMTDYDEAVALVGKHQEAVDFAGPRDETLIVAAETALGITFPPTYRRFVREFGALGIGSEELYGITDSNFTQSAVPNGIWLTLKYRSRSHLPDSMIIVYSVGDGEYFVLDISQTDATGECPVVVWDPGVNEGDYLETIASDFGALFLMTVKEGIASLADED